MLTESYYDEFLGAFLGSESHEYVFVPNIFKSSQGTGNTDIHEV